ncbi:unnamed protein product [Linum trigynum]|uniref:Uncharacterized protein n=1 Tax=Linum trigynum TaxID=586398 RepID=A0AAV2CF66_9ROSI
MQGGEDGTCKAMQGTTMTTTTEDRPAATADRPWIWRMKKGRRLRPLRFFRLCSSRQPPRMKKDGMATKTDDRSSLLQPAATPSPSWPSFAGSRWRTTTIEDERLLDLDGGQQRFFF